MDCFVLQSKRGGQGLPLVAFRLDSARCFPFDEFAVSRELRRQGGWMVPAYTMAPHAETVNVLRVVVRQDFTDVRCDVFVDDLRACLRRLGSRLSVGGKRNGSLGNGVLEP